jgi:hypothetical protein
MTSAKSVSLEYSKKSRRSPLMLSLFQEFPVGNRRAVLTAFVNDILGEAYCKFPVNLNSEHVFFLKTGTITIKEHCQWGKIADHTYKLTGFSGNWKDHLRSLS